MPAGIRDCKLLDLLGDILGSERELKAAGDMRLRLMQQGFSWQALVDLAMVQGVLLPLIFTLTARGLLPPVPRSNKNGGRHVTARLGEVYLQHLARRQSEKIQLEEVLLVLNRAGIVPLILKGARYLVEPVATWCEARSIADFDILVRPGDAERASSVLKAEGYRERTNDSYVYRPDHSHHLPALLRSDHPAEVEIHTDALDVTGQAIMSTQHVWAHAIRAGDGSCFVMSTRWHALHELLHHQIQDHGHIRRTMAVKGLWEWTMLAREFAIEDWDAITAHMRAMGVSDVLESWVMQSHRLFGLEIPSLLTISAIARAHADATFRRASKPYWMRRTMFVADELRFSFAREKLAANFGIPPSRVSLLHAGKNIAEIFRRNRGKLLRRLIGNRDQLR
jgi:hypothetical protein